MPQVRIRNVSKEYKLVAGVFSPDLLKIEEHWGKPKDPMLAYATAQANVPLKSKSQLSNRDYINRHRHPKPRNNKNYGNESDLGGSNSVMPRY